MKIRFLLILQIFSICAQSEFEICADDIHEIKPKCQFNPNLKVPDNFHLKLSSVDGFAEEFTQKEYQKLEVNVDLIERTSEDLLLYRMGIQKIQEKFEEIYEDYAGDFRLGFYGANENYDVTPNDILIGVSYIRDEIKYLGHISSPMGAIDPTRGGLGEYLTEFAVRVMSEMDWDIEEVTQRIENYGYIQDKNKVFGPTYLPENLESYRGACDRLKIYRIKRIEDITFPTPPQIIRFPHPVLRNEWREHLLRQYRYEEENKPIIPSKTHEVEIKVIPN